MEAQKVIDQFEGLVTKYYSVTFELIKTNLRYPASVQKEKELDAECHQLKADFLKAVKELLEPASRKRVNKDEKLIDEES